MSSAITFDEASDHFMSAVGEGALQPSRALSTVAHNGVWTLRNVTGYLGTVTSNGKVFARPCGQRLDEVSS